MFRFRELVDANRKEIDGRPVAKRGRIPGRTENPRLERIDLQR